MRRVAITMTLGAVLLIAAVAGFVIVPRHAPGFRTVQIKGATASSNPITGSNGGCPAGTSPSSGSPVLNLGQPVAANCDKPIATGLSQTTYDALTIATWAVLIVGLLLVIVGLIGFARRPHPSG